MRSFILLVMVYAGAAAGYLCGYNEGFDMGRVIGKLDSKMCFLHNGVKE